MTRLLTRRMYAAVFALTLALLLGACTTATTTDSGSQDSAAAADGSGEIGDIAVSGAWARPAERGGTTAVYLVINNKGTTDDALFDVAAPDVTDEAMLHESKMIDNVMHMDHVHQIDVPAGGTVTLERGGLHIMLIDVKDELRVGDRVSVTLFFEHAGDLTLEVPVIEQ